MIDIVINEPKALDLEGHEPLLRAMTVIGTLSFDRDVQKMVAGVTNPVALLHGSLHLNLVLLTWIEQQHGIAPADFIERMRAAYVDESASRT